MIIDMLRLIILGLLIYLVIVAFKRGSNQIGSKSKDKNIPMDSPASEKEIENMVQCAACAVHLPRSEAFLVNGSFYCSKSHIPN
jgi:K+ transporter